MISRCPSCAAEVDEAATRCPSCHWDFELRQRVPPGDGAAGEEKAPAKPAKEIRPEAKPAKEAKKPGPDDENPSPEPSPPPGSGLKQFSKVAPPPPPKHDDVPQKSGFSIPVLSDVKKGDRENDGPPMTEVRRLPSAKPPEGADKNDAAERFKKRGKTLPKPKEPPKPVKAFTVNAKFVAGAAAALLVTIVAIFLSRRPAPPLEPRTQTEPAPVLAPARPQDSKPPQGAEKILNAVQNAVAGPEPDRDIRQIQRVGIDPLHPEAGLVKVDARTP
ncbi:MAG: hypothetical protein HY077_18080, partial [Elusimicrobia bacterium]|nr:hypothetical protein [Elusimicrobiota bacterium]